MNQFEYMMVLVSIIVGLGIAHILLGVGGIIDRVSGHGERLRLSVAHAAWLGMVFMWMVLFWWWEYRFSVLEPAWTVGLYFFLVLYSVALFLLTVILVPRTWDGVTSLDDYLIQRRVPFYSMLLFGTGLDVLDSYLKGGWSYILDAGPWAWGFWIALLPACVVGVRSRAVRHHTVMGVGFFLWQVAVGFVTLPTLGF